MTNIGKEDLKINFFFQKGSDIGEVCDGLLVLVPSLTAFNDATGHIATGKQDVFVAEDQDIQVFTDYKTFVTLSPLNENGEMKGTILLYHIAALPEFTQMSAEPLIVEKGA